MTVIMENGNSATITESGTNEQKEIERELELAELQESADRQAPKLSDVEWINVFPEVKIRWGKHVARSLKLQKIKAPITIEGLQWEMRHELRLYYQRMPGQEHEWMAEIITDRYRHQIRQLEKEVRACEERLRFLRTIGKKHDPTKPVIVTEGMIQRAKAYPIEKLIEINRAGFTRCFQHTDKTPSAYAKKGFLYCFVCTKKWDCIAILMERDGYKFKEAVLKLQF